MPFLEDGITLKPGSIAKIARKVGRTPQHIGMVYKRRRPASLEVLRVFRDMARLQSNTKHKKVA